MRFRSITYKLSLAITFLMLMASAGGLLLEDLYRDNELVTNAWYANDWATLIVALPILLISTIFSARGSSRAGFVMLGMLGYALYNYAFYLFGAAFNNFFLIYLAIFTLSIYALATGLGSLQTGRVRELIHEKAPLRWVAALLLFIGIPLGIVEILMALKFIVTTELPEIVIATGHVTAVVFALDLSLIVPNMILAAILLWKRRTWGFILGAIMSVIGFTYMLSLIFVTLRSQMVHPEKIQDPFLPFYIFTGLASLLSAFMLLRR